MFRNIYLLILICLSANTFAQREIENKKALKYLRGRGEVYFKFDSQALDAEKVSQLVSTDHKMSGKWQYAYANIQQFVKLQELNVDYTIETPPSLVRSFTMAKKTDEVFNWNRYPTYDQYVEMMQGFATKYPNICRLENIGSTTAGRDLLFVKISDNVTEEEAEPDFMYSSTMHGDETAGYILLLRLIDYLLTNYETSDFVRDLVNETEIWINPLANPDGTYSKGNSSISGATRGNYNGLDLNRNFPSLPFGEHPDNEEWQAETAAMMEFMNKFNFVLSANLHGGAEVVNYPWDMWSELHPDDTWYRTLSRAYADTVHKYAAPGYFRDMENGVTNGYKWYQASGTRQDYTNTHLHGREVTIELSASKTPKETELNDLWDANYQSLLHYIKASQFGIRGVIRDRDTQQPLRAKIEIEGHDRDNSYIYSEVSNGNYHRLLAPNTYTITVSKPGYFPKTVEGIQVADGETTWQDIELESTYLYSHFLGIEQIAIGPNPANETTRLTFKLSEPNYVQISITDFSGRTVFNTQDNYEQGEHSIPVFAKQMTAGLYLCNVRTKKQNKQLKIIVLK